MKARTVKAILWRDRALARCSLPARYLFVGLIGHADDQGRMDADPRLVRSLIFPYDENVTVEDVERGLAALAEAGVIVRYEVDGDPYLALPAWNRYQRIRGAEPSRVPPPPGDDAQDAQGSLVEVEPVKAPPPVPDGVDLGLLARVAEVLRDTAATNGHPRPVEVVDAAVGRAILDHPERDHLQVAKDYRAWQVGGTGATPAKDVVRGYRNQLKRAARFRGPAPVAAPSVADVNAAAERALREAGMA